MLKVPVPGCAHLVPAREIQPQLEPFHQTIALLGQFGVNHATTRRHPLDSTWFKQAFIADAVAVPHAPGNHVSDGFETSMRVIGKACEIIVRVVAAKCIQHQERIKSTLQRLREHTIELHARAIGSRLARHESLHAARAIQVQGRRFGQAIGCVHGG